MMNDKIQKQEAGDGSTNLQGQSIIIHQGISYSDAKEIALDVYKSNFIQLSQSAGELAQKRAEEITDNFLTKLKEDNKDAINSMQDPSMQSALYEIQKQYVKTGDKDLEELLVDILVERASVTERNLHQIVLDESLTIASKLTLEQMDALTLNFIISQTSNSTLLNLDKLIEYLKTHITPFIGSITDNSSCYKHLDYVGCISLMHMQSMKKIEEIFLLQYPGLFSKGFTKEKFENDIGNFNEFHNIIISCLHDPDLFQISAINEEVINKICESNNITNENKTKIVNLFNSCKFSSSEVKKYILDKIPEIEKLFKLWDESGLSKFNFTTVGIAIAQANFRRKSGIKLDLSMWVN